MSTAATLSVRGLELQSISQVRNDHQSGNLRHFQKQNCQVLQIGHKIVDYNAAIQHVPSSSFSACLPAAAEDELQE
jgi:hypothetical protein